MTDFIRQPLWHKGAVIYEVHVKSFCDASGDGRGDLRGLIEKLDYIRNLGVTAIWVLPLYPSPQRDDGYDISDYLSIHPGYGTLDDFRQLIAEAHARGLYVITELVLNHTSDQHPWFQRARRAKPGSRERDFYVWSDTKEKYRDARIIFKDFEPSNWSWDPLAGAYYWHRFYAHQPDLNYDNPEVHAAMYAIVDFWLEMGVDGLRLDAVPYLYEREGTSCENLPETHAFLRKLAGHVRSHFDHRMLLAEANQWPEDAIAYFGEGEACDMAFHFPLMPRLYMAVEMADRFPIIDILEQTPSLPSAASQWAIFLRNHDELTLEMVTDEERDYMYRAYARDDRARINLGIRRRLAPLMGGNRRKIELMLQLLLSLPGAPVLYYGDEIGMGDNIYLGDRDSVRTPMQWSPDRNAGFSRANAQRLYLPVIVDPEYHYETVNVENQERNANSLLWWTRKRLFLRQSSPALREGSLTFLNADNTRVMAFLREAQGETVLVTINLSAYAQSARIDLTGHAGCEPVELAGGAVFPRIEDRPYPVMLGPHESYWLRLTAVQGASAPVLLPQIGDYASLADMLGGEGASLFVDKALAPYLTRMPWHESAPRALQKLVMRDSWVLPGDMAFLMVARASYPSLYPESGDDYALVFAFQPGPLPVDMPAASVLAELRLAGVAGYIVEGHQSVAARSAWMGLLATPRALPMRHGILAVDGSPLENAPDDAAQTRVQWLPETDTQALRLFMPDSWVMRWFRAPRAGQEADMQMLGALAGRFSPPVAPMCLSRLRYLAPGEAPVLLGYAQSYVKADRDAAALAGEHLELFLDKAMVLGAEAFENEEAVRECLDSAWAERVAHLGRQLAALHLALSDMDSDPEFSGEPFTMLYQQGAYHGIRSLIRRQFARLAAWPMPSDRDLALTVTELLVRETDLRLALKRLIDEPIALKRLRIHGDLVLEKLLFTGRDFVFTSFDGEPWRGPGERRHRLCVLRDLATLCHSLEQLGYATARAWQTRSAAFAQAPRWAMAWSELSGRMLSEAYFEAMGTCPALPASAAQRRCLVEAFRIERATQELKAYLEPSPERAYAACHTLLRLARRARSV